MKDVVGQTARDIKVMKVRGALDIAIAAAEALRHSVSADKTYRELVKDGLKLKAARPTAVSLPNAVDICLKIVGKNKSLGKDAKKLSINQISKFIVDQKSSIAKIAEFGSRLIETNNTILTHCQSDTVEGILIKARKNGVKFKVVCTETRPRMQGYVTARILRKHKIPTTLIIDSAVNYFMKKLEVDKVFVGADAVLANGDVINKIGTSQVAVCAQAMETEFIVATQSIKFAPESVYGKLIEIEDRGAKEITTKLKGVKILNPAFDITPAHHISKIVTEYGIIPPAGAVQMIEHLMLK